MFSQILKKKLKEKKNICDNILFFLKNMIANACLPNQLTKNSSELKKFVIDKLLISLLKFLSI